MSPLTASLPKIHAIHRSLCEFSQTTRVLLFQSSTLLPCSSVAIQCAWARPSYRQPIRDRIIQPADLLDSIGKNTGGLRGLQLGLRVIVSLFVTPSGLALVWHLQSTHQHPGVFLPLRRPRDEFEFAISQIRPGQRTPVFQTAFGFHIAYLEARRPAGIPALGEIWDKVKAQALAANQRQAVERLLDKLRAEAVIEYPLA